MQMGRAVLEERAQKDIAVQQALAQVRNEMQGKIDSVSGLVQNRGDLQEKVDTVTITDDKNTVVYLWPAQAGQDIMDVTDDSDRDKD